MGEEELAEERERIDKKRSKKPPERPEKAEDTPGVSTTGAQYQDSVQG